MKPAATLASLWLGFFVLNSVSVVWLYYSDRIGGDNFRDAMAQLNALYVPYLGAVISFFFTKGAEASDAARTRQAFYLAVSATLLWNLFPTIALSRLLLSYGFIEPTVKEIRDIGAGLSWLVAPTIGYYFGKSVSEPSR